MRFEATVKAKGFYWFLRDPSMFADPWWCVHARATIWGGGGPCSSPPTAETPGRELPPTGAHTPKRLPT
jgi:hypothetical protein